jgi:hypothetical protein
MKRSTIVAAACALTIGAAQAATNGTLGTSSTGTQSVSLSVQDPADNRVRITGINDVDLGTLNPGRSNNAFTSYCFYHTSPTFSLTVQQSDVDSGFALLGPNSAAVPLDLTLSLVDSSGFFISYKPVNGVARTGLVGNRTSETCQTGGFVNSGQYSATTAADQLPGSYTGTITFVMAVE